MNILEAFKYFEEGKKIRCVDWKDDCFIALNLENKVAFSWGKDSLVIVSNELKQCISKSTDAFSYLDIVSEWEVVE